MFKKLKAKIEEGGDGGIENISFSPRRTPGTAVRSQSIETSGGSCRGESAQVSRSPSPTQESRDEDQDEGVTVSPVPRNHSQASDLVRGRSYPRGDYFSLCSKCVI